MNAKVSYQVAFQNIRCIRVLDRYEIRVNPSHLSDRDGPEVMLLFRPSDWNGVLGALSILMPCLGETIGYIVIGLAIYVSWVVRRPHLKGYDGAPINE